MNVVILFVYAAFIGLYTFQFYIMSCFCWNMGRGFVGVFFSQNVSMKKYEFEIGIKIYVSYFFTVLYMM